MADYNIYKRAIRKLCAEYDEYVLLPGLSEHIKISEQNQGLAKGVSATHEVRFEGSDTVDVFSLPSSDVAVLPVHNITLESMSKLFADRILDEHAETMRDHGVVELSVTVSSGPGQTAQYGAVL